MSDVFFIAVPHIHPPSRYRFDSRRDFVLWVIEKYPNYPEDSFENDSSEAFDLAVEFFTHDLATFYMIQDHDDLKRAIGTTGHQAPKVRALAREIQGEVEEIGSWK